MMTLAEIRNCATIIDTGPNHGRTHESVLRSFQVVQKVKELLAEGTPTPVLLEIINDLMDAPGKDFELKRQ